MSNLTVNFSVNDMVSNTSIGEQPAAVAVLNQVRTVVQCMVAPIIVFLGVCANSLNIIILSKKWMRSSTSVYLIALAAYDILYLLMSAFNNLNFCSPTLIHQSAAKRGIPLSNLFSNTAVLIICTFSLERYIAVSYPIRGRVWCTVKRATMTTGCVCIVGAMLTVPDFLPQKIQDVLDTSIRYSWLNTIIFTYIPIVFLIFSNALLIKAVYQARSLRNHLQQTARRTPTRSCNGEHRSSRSLGNENSALGTDSRSRRANSEQNKLTVMLIVVVIVFVVCQLPQAILYLWKRYHDARQIKMTDSANIIRRIVGNFSNMLVQINAASNFVLYSLFSTRFRATFRRTFCICGVRNKDSTTLADCNGTIIQRSSPTNCTHLQRQPVQCSDSLPKASLLSRKESCRSRASAGGTVAEVNV